VQAPEGARLAVRRRVAHRLQGTPRLFAAILRTQAAFQRARYRARHTTKGWRTEQSLRVRGFWRDNWVADRLHVVIDPSDHARRLKMVGRPVADMSVCVSSNGDELARFDLRQNRQEDVVVELPAGPRELITFSFSEHGPDPQGRPIAFLLQETNMFREDDLYSLG
jgi:hypothetical protein